MYLRSTSSHPARPYLLRPSGVAIRLITGGPRFKSWRAHQILLEFWRGVVLTDRAEGGGGAPEPHSKTGTLQL